MKKAGKAPTRHEGRHDERVDEAAAPPRGDHADARSRSRNARRNATPTRKIEYGSVRPTTSETGVG